MALKLGVMPVLGGGLAAADPTATADFVRVVEELGVESLWTVEHVVIPDSYESAYPYDGSGRMSLLPEDEVPDPLEWLTFAAAHSIRLLLGTAMLILPEHNPVILAKRLATVDALSGGRLLAGVGVGWLREEYEAVTGAGGGVGITGAGGGEGITGAGGGEGITGAGGGEGIGVPFEQRGARTDEYLAAMRALWTCAPASFHGKYVSFDAVHSRPRPVRSTGVPIVVGGHSARAVRRAALYGDGLYPLGVDLDGMAGLVARLRQECARIGRDPSSVELTARAPGRPETVRALADLGVSRVVMRVYPADLDRVRADVVRYQTDVLS